MRKIFLLGGVLLSAAITWFAVGNYLSARPVAEENLRGLALSLTAAIENIALHDPTLRSLSTFRTHDIAFFALVDRKGAYRFHSNPDLIGKALQGTMPLATLRDGATSDVRITLRTGENAFEFNAPVYLPGETLALRLTLHTHRADAVIRRARLNMTVLFSLLAAGWTLALALYRFTRREEQHKLAMARREALAQLGEMGAMLAHEIRNPLAGIKGYAQLIDKRPRDERNSGFARRIVAEAQRMEALVSDLLAYARRTRDPMSPVELNRVISHAADLLRHEAETRHLQISCECPEGLQVTGNADSLGQVLLNLGKNAIQAMPDGGSLRITAAGGGNVVKIEVSDTGIGISGEEMPRIFEPFFTTKAKGTGLGLALCRKIVEEHGGGIEVESTVGEGTLVSITLPVGANLQ
ncbi:MAG: histidine kinase [Geobacteraceae bacterium GWC2_58_44]|nr:MAG: histidine kinase [Geobacteraceae bacterium GWC2_58_44]